VRRLRSALALSVATAAALATPGAALPATVSGISFTRTDGTLVEFGLRTTVDCRTITHSGRRIQVLRVTVGGVPGPTKRAYWQAEVLPRKGVLRFPAAATPASPDGTGASLFAYDATRKDEVSSSSEPAKGAMRITAAACAPRPRLAFTVNATLGGEAGGRPLRTIGRIDVRG
jgi:hypothetical protein